MNRAAVGWIEVRMLVGEANRRTGRRVGERGEGVISTAIAVLIVAFIGAAMWVAFNSIWSAAEADISDQVDTIGR